MWKLVTGTLLSYGTYVYCHKTAIDIIKEAQPALFRINFTNKETLESEGYASGFFISADGVALTSGPVLSAHKDAKLMIQLQNGSTYEAEPVVFPTAPGLGFLTVKHLEEKFQFVPHTSQPDSVQEGDRVYTIGLLHTHLYFTDVYVTNTRRQSAIQEGNTLTLFDTVLLTGQLSPVCVGGPLLNEDGKAVAVVINLEMGMGVAIPLSYMKKVKEEENGGKFKKAYGKFKSGLFEMMQGLGK